MLQDLRYAVRSLAKTPALTLTAVVALALGIGINTTVFSCVNALFLRPFPYREPGRLVSVREAFPAQGVEDNEVAYPNFVDWRAQSRGFEQLAAHFTQSFNLASVDEPERLEGESVSWNMFRLLGVSPMLGRDFREDEGRPGAERVVILSAGLWRRRFGADSGVLGRVVSLNGTPHTVIGVLPPPHQFPGDQQL
ncbi:MAG: ABC transporter permease, partial [Gemmatimonadales bacterium]